LIAELQSYPILFFFRTYIKQLIDEANNEIEHEIEDLTNEIEDEIEVISRNQMKKTTTHKQKNIKRQPGVCFFSLVKLLQLLSFCVCSFSFSSFVHTHVSVIHCGPS
jgi:hypothetical protein